MLHPIGKLPPTVYWTRRLIVVGLPILFIVLILFALLSGGDGKKASAGQVATSARATHEPTVTGSAPTKARTAAPASTPPRAAAPVPPCTAAMLAVTAMTAQPSYLVGTQPELFMVVTDIAAKPCRQDLADPQIELIVLTGDVRVWGSRDCNPQSGIDVETLVPKKPVRRAVIWSGQTSAPNCAGTRLVSAAGTYTLYARLAGQQSPAATFVLAAAQ